MPNHYKDNALTFEPCSRACLGVSGAKQKASSMIFSAHRIALVSSIKKSIMTIFIFSNGHHEYIARLLDVSNLFGLLYLCK